MRNLIIGFMLGSLVAIGGAEGIKVVTSTPSTPSPKISAFGNILLAPGDRVVIAKNPATFSASEDNTLLDYTVPDGATNIRGIFNMTGTLAH